MKRRSPLSRTSGLKRSPMKRRKRRRARPGKDDKAYKAWVKTLQCSWCGAPGPCDPHHETGAGMGTTAPDRDAVPLCRSLQRSCHDDMQEFRGEFKNWTREQRKDWHRGQVAILNRIYDTTVKSCPATASTTPF